MVIISSKSSSSIACVGATTDVSQSSQISKLVFWLLCFAGITGNGSCFLDSLGLPHSWLASISNCCPPITLLFGLPGCDCCFLKFFPTSLFLNLGGRLFNEEASSLPGVFNLSLLSSWLLWGLAAVFISFCHSVLSTGTFNQCVAPVKSIEESFLASLSSTCVGDDNTVSHVPAPMHLSVESCGKENSHKLSSFLVNYQPLIKN